MGRRKTRRRSSSGWGRWRWGGRDGHSHQRFHGYSGTRLLEPPLLLDALGYLLPVVASSPDIAGHFTHAVPVYCACDTGGVGAVGVEERIVVERHCGLGAVYGVELGGVYPLPLFCSCLHCLLLLSLQPREERSDEQDILSCVDVWYNGFAVASLQPS